MTKPYNDAREGSNYCGSVKKKNSVDKTGNISHRFTRLCTPYIEEPDSRILNKSQKNILHRHSSLVSVLAVAATVAAVQGVDFCIPERMVARDHCFLGALLRR
eukprot:m.682601 g.682601  ORF g.682601 m.682601 type:complete len:103 (-) comp22821_c0_seq6:659-967(-)